MHQERLRGEVNECSKHVVIVANPHSHTGAVFRRSNTGQATSSGNGVGTEPISWQGYEVVTGRINSQNLGIIGYFCLNINVWYFRFHCVSTKVW